MAADQRRKRVNGASVVGYGSKEQHRTKRKNPGPVQNGMRSHISVEWDNNRKIVVAKREQVGISWRQMKPFVNYVSKDHKVLADVLTVPQEIFEMDNLSEVLSYEVWTTHLSENERNLLMNFLPRGIEPHQIVEDLLAGTDFDFGNPFLNWGASVCSGNLHPDIIIDREQHLKSEKRAYYTQLHNYHNDMIGFLSKLKERWQSCRDPEKELLQKMWRPKHVQKRMPLNVKVYDHDGNVTVTSESCSWDTEEKACSSDYLISSLRKDDKLQRKVVEKGIVKCKSRNLMLASDGMHITGGKPKKADKVLKRNIHFIDGDKYMSCIKISRQQHELVKNMKQSGKSIQSKSLNRVLGNLNNIHVQPYKVFVKEEQKKLHEHWLQLVIKDIPVAYANWMQRQIERDAVRNSLVEEMKGKSAPNFEEEGYVSLGRELQDQDEAMSLGGEPRDQNEDNLSPPGRELQDQDEAMSLGGEARDQNEDNLSPAEDQNDDVSPGGELQDQDEAMSLGGEPRDQNEDNLSPAEDQNDDVSLRCELHDQDEDNIGPVEDQNEDVSSGSKLQDHDKDNISPLEDQNEDVSSGSKLQDHDKDNISLLEDQNEDVSSGSELQDQYKDNISLMEDQNEDVSSGSEHQDQDKNNIGPIEDQNEDVSSGGELQDQDEDNMSSGDEFQNVVEDGRGLNDQSNLKDYDDSVVRAPEIRSSHNSFSSCDCDNGFNRVNADSGKNIVLTKPDDTSPNKDKYPRNMNTEDVSTDQGVPFSSGSGVWQSVEMPHSYYDSAVTHKYTANGLSLSNSQVNEDHLTHVIDLEADDLHQETGKELLHEHLDNGTSFSSYESQDRGALIHSLFNGEGLLPYHHEQKGAPLDFQTSNNVMMSDGQCSGHFKEPLQMSLTLDPGQSRATEVYMPESMSQNIHSNAGGRYLIPSQDPFIARQDPFIPRQDPFIPRPDSLASVNVTDWAANTTYMAAPSQSQLNTGNFIGHHWPPSNHQVRGGWNGSVGSSLSTQSVGTGANTDQGLFNILSQCNQLRPGSSYESIRNPDQFLAPRTFGVDAGPIRMNPAAALPPQSSNPLDYFTGREAAPSGLVPDDMTWVNLQPPNSSLHDPMGKPYLRSSWNR